MNTAGPIGLDIVRGGEPRMSLSFTPDPHFPARREFANPMIRMHRHP